MIISSRRKWIHFSWPTTKSVLESKEAGGRKAKVFTIYINAEIWRIFCKEQYWWSDYSSWKKKKTNLPVITQKWIFPQNNQCLKSLPPCPSILLSIPLSVHPLISIPIYLNIYLKDTKQVLLRMKKRWAAKHPLKLKWNRYCWRIHIRVYAFGHVFI